MTIVTKNVIVYCSNISKIISFSFYSSNKSCKQSDASKRPLPINGYPGVLVPASPVPSRGNVGNSTTSVPASANLYQVPAPAEVLLGTV